MSKINDGGPAFPMHPNSWEYGMTLRDWFAGQALEGLSYHYTAKDAVKLAYEMADAMLKAREVKP
jgi:hypothetical protein